MNFTYQDFISLLIFFSCFRLLSFVVVILVHIFLFYLIEVEHLVTYLTVIKNFLVYHFVYLNSQIVDFINLLTFFYFFHFLSFVVLIPLHKFLFYLIGVEGYMINLIVSVHFSVFHFEYMDY
jgi:hypothetical protein